MKEQRAFPRFDIKLVPSGQFYAAFLIDHDTGEHWILDSDMTWKKIRKSKGTIKSQKKKYKL